MFETSFFNMLASNLELWQLALPDCTIPVSCRIWLLDNDYFVITGSHNDITVEVCPRYSLLLLRMCHLCTLNTKSVSFSYKELSSHPNSNSDRANILQHLKKVSIYTHPVQHSEFLLVGLYIEQCLMIQICMLLQ